MLSKTLRTPDKKESVLTVSKARTAGEVEEALRLRFEVFNLEMEEGLVSSYATGLDEDGYDEYCDHIIVTDASRDKVVGTYRLMTGAMAEAGMGFYSETEFDLGGLKSLPGVKVELGRACVHKEYRGTSVLNLMWHGIARYIEEKDARMVFGCGSIHTINPVIVSNIYSYLKSGYMSEENVRVRPLKGVPGFDPDAALDRGSVLKHIPALMFGYLKLGARICGEPAYDPEFGVSDFLILLNRERLLSKYNNRYF